ncbi:universal stress protein [Natrialba sp. PRR66]|uniref:universal stress protein n=1 Tax=Natrialba sp. PRR66 TaxID=3098146 RepID=UPI0034E0C378
MQNALDSINVPPVETKEIVVLETPQKAIIEYLLDNPVDVVIMGRTGKSAVERLLLGSVSDRVIKLADTPVMVVK